MNIIGLIAPLGIKYMKQEGILASLTLAQAILESDSGKSELSMKANNLFGIKNNSSWDGAVYKKKTKEYVNGKWIEITASFCKFESLEECIEYRSKVFLKRAHYKPLWGVSDYKEACRIIWECGYATDLKYPQKLIEVIEKYKLFKYDEELYQMKIIPMLIPDKVKPKYNVNGKKVTFSMNPEYITIHETANTAKGANDLAHAKLQKNGNSRQASWHLQVDEDSCYQSLPYTEAGMHAGDGAYGNGNRKSIGIEICVNSDGDFEKAIKNAANVTAQLMIQFNIPSHKVVPHKHWSGKNCPANLLKGRWQEYINLCIAERGKLENDNKEEVKLYNPNSKALLFSTEQTLKELVKEGVISDVWVKKLQKGELTESEATGLLFVAMQRKFMK